MPQVRFDMDESPSPRTVSPSTPMPDQNGFPYLTRIFEPSADLAHADLYEDEDELSADGSIARPYRQAEQDEWTERELAALRQDREEAEQVRDLYYVHNGGANMNGSDDVEMLDEYIPSRTESGTHEELAGLEDLTAAEIYRMITFESASELMPNGFQQDDDTMSTASDESAEPIDPFRSVQVHTDLTSRITDEEERDPDGRLRWIADQMYNLWRTEVQAAVSEGRETLPYSARLGVCLAELNHSQIPRCVTVNVMVQDLMDRWEEIDESESSEVEEEKEEE